MIAFVDTTVPAYASGAPHRLQPPSAAILDAIGQDNQQVVTSAEVLQELFHVSLRRRGPTVAAEVVRAFDRLVGRVLSVDRRVVLAAVAHDRAPVLGGRDRVHLELMRQAGASAIITADRGFDLVPDIRRLDPADFATWRDEVFAR